MEDRVKMLKQMDRHVRNDIGDDEITCCVWLAGGVPDGACEEDYEDIAEDTDSYVDVMECFVRCCLIDAERNK